MIGYLLRPEIEELIREKNWDVLRETFCQFHPSDIAEILTDVPDADDVADDRRGAVADASVGRAHRRVCLHSYPDIIHCSRHQESRTSLR